MKEKVKKAFKRITPNLVMVWFNLAIFAYHIFLSFTHDMWEIAMIGTPYLIIALLAFELHGNDKTIRRLKAELVETADIGLFYIHKVERYHKRYGELPPEEEPKPSESEKQNSEESKESGE